VESFLSNPDTDPHGDPIPDSNLDISSRNDRVSLNSIDEGTSITIRRILTEEREMLEYLANEGLEPGASITVEEHTPIGLIVVSTATDQQQLPIDIAQQIVVSRLRTE
jgi:DtxR family Mn-dependent transcriptional regulator